MMEAYRVLKELLISIGLEGDLPTFKQFKIIYNEERELN
jgi:hypothetical protein